MALRDFGHTGLRVSPLGFGAMHINDHRTSEDEAGHLLNAVLDLGVNLIDTARGYGPARCGVNIGFVYHHQLRTVFTERVQPVLVVNLHAVQAVERCNVDGANQLACGNVNLKYLGATLSQMARRFNAVVAHIGKALQ